MPYQALVHRAEAPEKTSSEPPLIEVKSLNDVQILGPHSLHAVEAHKSYRIDIISLDRASKQAVVRVNGAPYTVILKDALDLLVEKMGMSGEANAKAAATLRAPMPGLIIQVKAKQGDTVAAGDPLLVLEAMKMENTLLAPSSGVIKVVTVEPGKSVEKGQLLIEIEPLSSPRSG